MTENPQKLLTLDDVCQKLSIKESHLRSLVFAKKVPIIKIGRLLRFSQEEIEQWISNQKKEPQQS